MAEAPETSGASLTSFEGMSHKQMIAWLDQANSTAVQTVADRLAHAGAEIDKIAGELKIRPQWVKWEGEGAFSFRVWSADLANETLRLGEFSKGAAEQLSLAAQAIALAKAATPRPAVGDTANYEAALAARNDPDAKEIVQKLGPELQAQRLVAADQMKKLAEAYHQSKELLGRLDKPEFPPPPQAIAPPEGEQVNADQRYLGSAGGDSGAAAGASATRAGYSPVNNPNQLGMVSSATGMISPPSGPAVPRAVEMNIDNITTLPNAPVPPQHSPVSPPGGGRSDVVAVPILGTPPSVLSGSQKGFPGPATGGRTGGTTRPPALPGQATAGPGSVARMPRDNGIAGGRPVPQNSGRPTGGLPRGTVIGGEGAHGRGPMGHGAGMGGFSGGGANGMTGGRRVAGETGGMVGGRPQQPGRSTSRPFTPGGTGLVRGSAAGDGSRGAGQAGRTGATTPQRARDPRRDEGERPDYLIEDEETWQQGGRRVVPPVID